MAIFCDRLEIRIIAQGGSEMKRKLFLSKLLGAVSFLVFISLFVLPVHAQEIIFLDGFEDPGTEWEIYNGVWEIGEPTSGPGDCYGGTRCAGTVLAGNYPNYTDSRLISHVQNPPAGPVV